jgi:hypothetical protein
MWAKCPPCCGSGKPPQRASSRLDLVHERAHLQTCCPSAQTGQSRVPACRVRAQQPGEVSKCALAVPTLPHIVTLKCNSCRLALTSLSPDACRSVTTTLFPPIILCECLLFNTWYNAGKVGRELPRPQMRWKACQHSLCICVCMGTLLLRHSYG